MLVPPCLRARRVRALLTAVLALIGFGGLASTASAAATCAAQGLTISPLQSSVFYIDPSSSYLGAYVGYKVANGASASPRSNLWLRLESFTGTVVKPADGGTTTAPVPLDALAAGAATPSYAYLKASGPTTAAQGHDVVVYTGRPGSGGVELCRQTQSIIEVASTIKAAANKVTGGSLSSTSASLGGSFQLTITGDTGTFGAGMSNDPGVFRLSPAVAANWPSSSFRLMSVSHKLPLSGAATLDVLSRSGLSSWADTPYSVTYTFRVVGPTTVATPVVPVQNIASGTQVKHTDPSSLSSLAPIPVVTSSASMSVTAPTAGPYSSGQSVPLTATITNAGTGAIAVDEVVAKLPAGWSYEAGSAHRDGALIADPAASGGLLHLVGPFTVAGSSSTTFTLSATAGAPGTSGTMTAYGVLEGGQIDGTVSASDNAPASVALAVLGTPTAADDTASAASGVARDIDVVANDTLAGGTPTVTITRAPADGTAGVVDGKIHYTSSPGYIGSDSLEYTLTTAGGQDTGEVAITVNAPPAAPAPSAKSSAGVGTAPQTATLDVPADGSVRLVDGDGNRVTTWARPGVGTYVLVPATGVVTFTPVLGYTGSPAVGYEATDAYGQSGTATYTPAVTAPAAPTAPARTSSGVGTAIQTQTVPVPAGGSATLLDEDGHAVTTWTVAGEGTTVIDPATGELTFIPVLGFAHVATPAAYRLTDAYGHTGDATYTATVTAPAGPTAVPLSTTGTGVTPQTTTLAIPAGGSATLLTALGQPATTVAVLGQGTYVLDAATGVVTFTPVAGFAGTATSVAYRLTDPYTQTADATYTPAVTAPGGPSAAARTSTGVGTAPQSATLSHPAGTTVRLRDGGASVTSIVKPGKGVVTLAADTGVVTFTPVFGYAGTFSVTYRVTDLYGQSADATYTPTVTPPTGPHAVAATTSGVGTAPQAHTLAAPTGGTVELLDAAGHVVTQLVVAGQGTYRIDPADGRVTFTPVLGFKGTATPIRFRLTDAYGQQDEASYGPAVTAPALPAAPAQQSVGKPAETQDRPVEVPPGGSVELLDERGDAVRSWHIEGQGQYTIDDARSLITFTPDPGFTGTPSPVRYRVTDAYGQSTVASYQAEVEAAPAADAAPATAAPTTCFSRRAMTINWRVPAGSGVRAISLSLNGKRVARLPGSARRATVDLEGRPKQTVVVELVARAAHGKTLGTTRTYRTCRAKVTGPPLPTLRLTAPASRKR